jgi:hypothetical protein
MLEDLRRGTFGWDLVTLLQLLSLSLGHLQNQISSFDMKLHIPFAFRLQSEQHSRTVSFFATFTPTHY